MHYIVVGAFLHLFQKITCFSCFLFFPFFSLALVRSPSVELDELVLDLDWAKVLFR